MFQVILVNHPLHPKWPSIGKMIRMYVNAWELKSISFSVS